MIIQLEGGSRMIPETNTFLMESSYLMQLWLQVGSFEINVIGELHSSILTPVSVSP